MKKREEQMKEMSHGRKKGSVSAVGVRVIVLQKIALRKEERSEANDNILNSNCNELLIESLWNMQMQRKSQRLK